MAAMEGNFNTSKHCEDGKEKTDKRGGHFAKEQACSHVENTVESNSEMCANRIRAKLYVCNERSNTVTCTVGEVDL